MVSGGFRTEHLTVRPWRSEDASWYSAAIDDEVIRWTRLSGNPSGAEWEKIVESGAMANASASFCIENEFGDAVGALGKKLHSDTVELSYWLAAAGRGHGYAREALAGAVVWCADSHPGTPIVLEIHPGNGASIAVAEKTGFVFDGLRSSCASCADDNGHVAVYVMAS